MRLKLWRRRLTVSAPRVAVRSVLPWPVRWVVMALTLGFCAAIALWAFELGKDLAGLDDSAREEVAALRAEVARLREERDSARSVANTSGSLLTAERAAQEKLAQQIRALEAENRSLRADLGFFERLIPANAGENIAIRGLQAEWVGDGQMRWQVLVMQSARNPTEFRGHVEMSFAGTLGGRPWMLDLPGGPMAVQMHQYRRLEGVVELPTGVVVKTVTAKVTDGSGARAVQTLRM